MAKNGISMQMSESTIAMVMCSGSVYTPTGVQLEASIA